ncbi:MAG: cobalamin-binding protein [Thermodesulfobacteriota bacterium]
MPRSNIIKSILIFFLLLPGFGEASTRIFTDARGRPVRVSYPPQRIVSLAPSITENLFALGLGDRIVGVTVYCDYPPQAKEKEKVGGGINPSLEKIVSLKPDLVLGLEGASSLGAMSSLKKLGLAVYLFDSRGFAGILKTIEELGRLTGSERKADELLKEVEERVEMVARLIRASKRPKVLLVVWDEPIWTVGKDSFLSDLIEMAGGVSVTADLKGETALFSLEAIVERAPEIILVSLAFGLNRSRQPLKQLRRLNSIPAVRNKKIFALDSSLLNRPSYRVAQGLEKLARIFHPELFPD